MSPLGIPGTFSPRWRPALQPALQADAGSRVVGLTRASPDMESQVTLRRMASSLSLAPPQVTIMQAEMLLQIASTAASSPALRQIAAAAYQMEIDARREIASGVEGISSGRQWFA